MSKADHASPRRALARLAAPLAVTALVLGLAACSGSSTPSPARSTASTPPGPMLGATFSGTIYVSTATSHVTKAFVDHVRDVQNCAAAARTGDAGGAFKVPSPQAPDPEADIEITGFHGPGTYTPTMLQRDHADSILLSGKSGTSQYDITTPVANRTPGKEVLFLQKDGSGQLVYSGAHLNGQPADPAVAGLIQWNCTS